jgi:hypothetical protein
MLLNGLTGTLHGGATADNYYPVLLLLLLLLSLCRLLPKQCPIPGSILSKQMAHEHLTDSPQIRTDELTLTPPQMCNQKAQQLIKPQTPPPSAAAAAAAVHDSTTLLPPCSNQGDTAAGSSSSSSSCANAIVLSSPVQLACGSGRAETCTSRCVNGILLHSQQQQQPQRVRQVFLPCSLTAPPAHAHSHSGSSSSSSSNSSTSAGAAAVCAQLNGLSLVPAAAAAAPRPAAVVASSQSFSAPAASEACCTFSEATCAMSAAAACPGSDPRAAAVSAGAAAACQPDEQPSILKELGVSLDSLLRLLTGDCNVESQQPVWMVVNLQVCSIAGGGGRGGGPAAPPPHI